MLPNDWLSPFLLLHAKGNEDARELTEKLTGLGFEDVPTRTMLRTLRDMRKNGLISFDGDGSASRIVRRRYGITARGEQRLQFWSESFERYQDDVDLFLRLYSNESAERSALSR